MSTKNYTDNNVIDPIEPPREGWLAWIDKMPPPPDTLHVRGKVTVPNPGVDVFLYQRIPQGFNPAILQLSLVLVQRPGIWPQVVVSKPVSYSEVGRDLHYTQVEIFAGNDVVARIDVEIVH